MLSTRTLTIFLCQQRAAAHRRPCFRNQHSHTTQTTTTTISKYYNDDDDDESEHTDTTSTWIVNIKCNR